MILTRSAFRRAALLSAATPVLMLAACGGALATAPAAPAATIPDIETWMQIGYAGQPRVSPDGGLLYFTSAMSGVAQLHRLTPEGWPYQLTVFVDGIDFYEPSPDGTRLIVGASTGGSEYSQLHLVDGMTGALRTLTANPKVRYLGVNWAPDGRGIYYSSNETNGTDVQVFAMDLATGASRPVHAKKGAWYASDVSSDGRELLLTRFDSNEASDVYLLDIASGAETHLTPHEGSAWMVGARFSGDERRVWLTANTATDGLQRIGWIDLEAVRKGGKPDIRWLDPKSRWEVESFALSPAGRFLAWTENEDGYGALHLMDLESGKRLDVPDLGGISREPELADDGTLFFTFENAVQTSDVRRWDYRKGEYRTLTHSTYAGISTRGFREPELVRYTSFDGLAIPAFLYLPADRGDGKVPFVIHVHGGPESQFRPDFVRHFQYLLAHGYGILAPNIRGSRGYGREYLALDNYRKRLDSVKDIGAAAEWLISKGYTARGMLAIKGESYGGYMTMAALTEYPDLFSAGIEGIGIANFITFLQNTAPYRRALREAEYGPLSDSTFLREISPITHVDRIRAPLLVIAGENDPRVPVGEARQIAAALAARGQVADTLIFADEGHGVSKRPNVLIQCRRMVDFLDRHIGRGRSGRPE